MSVLSACAIDSPPCGPSTDSHASWPAAGESGVPSMVTPPVLRLLR